VPAARVAVLDFVEARTARSRGRGVWNGSPQMALLSWQLNSLGWLCWTIAYALIIVEGSRDKTYGVPLPALCANLSWEIIFSFGPFLSTLERLSVGLWLVLDLVIFSQYIRFWQTDYPKNLSRRLFIPMLSGTALFTFGIILLSLLYLHDDRVILLVPFGQNFMMSVLFVSMFLRRNSLSGQSFYIGLFKMLGTAVTFLSHFPIIPKEWLFDLVYLGIFVYDSAYVTMLYGKYRSLGMSPWGELIKRKAA
jgi:hypothetical protein